MPKPRMLRERVSAAVRRVASVRAPVRNVFFRVRSFLSRLPRDVKTLRESFGATVLQERGQPVAAVKIVGRSKGRALLFCSFCCRMCSYSNNGWKRN